MDKYYLGKALTSLKPNSEWIIKGGVIQWSDENDVQPTDAELQAEIDRLRAADNATQYQRDRQPEYPDLAVLADALYWSNQGDNTKLDEYYAAVSAVKAKYPKPEVN